VDASTAWLNVGFQIMSGRESLFYPIPDFNPEPPSGIPSAKRRESADTVEKSGDRGSRITLNHCCSIQFVDESIYRPVPLEIVFQQYRPLTAVHWSHSQWPFAVQKAAVRITLLKPPVLTHSGSRRFVLTNLKCKFEIRIVARDLLTFEGREVRSGEALSFPRNIG
jgi:hypothetical protein